MDWLLSNRLMASLLLDDARAGMALLHLASPDDAPTADLTVVPSSSSSRPCFKTLAGPKAKAAAGGDGAVLASAPLPHRLLPVLFLPYTKVSISMKVNLDMKKQ
jgi:hypothetical protein